MSRARDGLGGGFQDRETPPWLVAACEKRFGVKFILDAAASEQNKKCECFISEKNDSLKFDWLESMVRIYPEWTPDCPAAIWLNPPFRACGKWMRKCAEESKRGVKIVSLTLSATATVWYQHHVKPNAMSLVLLDRLKFGDARQPFNKECMISLWGFNMVGGPVYWRQGKK